MKNVIVDFIIFEIICEENTVCNEPKIYTNFPYLTIIENKKYIKENIKKLRVLLHVFIETSQSNKR